MSAPSMADGGRLGGKVVLVTGAAGGIGRAICRRVLEEGGRLVATDLDAERMDAVARELGGDRIVGLRCDVTDGEAVAAAVATAEQRFGALHAVCNVAGGSTDRDGTVTDMPEEEFWRAIRLNLFGTFLGCRHAIPAIARAGGGAVINFASILAFVPKTGRSAYAASKGGIIALTRSMAADYAAQGVRVNAIAPGRTVTLRTRDNIQTTGGLSDKIGSRHLLGLIDPDDVAHMAVYLASNEATKVTGQVMLIDSGTTVA